MANQNNGSLLDVLQKVASLPEYMRDDAIKNIVAEWRRESPLVDDVVSGRTTFEKAVAALVEENSQLHWLNYRRGVCNSEDFKRVAENTRKRFTGILPLSQTTMTLSRPPMPLLDDLTEVVSLKQSTSLQLKFIAIVTTLPSIAWIGVNYFLGQNFMSGLPWAIVVGLGLGLFLAGMLLFSGFPDYLSRRRRLAHQTRERARFLDTMLTPQPH